MATNTAAVARDAVRNTNDIWMYVNHEFTIAVITVIFGLVPWFLAIAVILCHGRDYRQNMYNFDIYTVNFV